MEVRLGSINGPLLTTMNIPNTGGNDRWELLTTDVPKVKGTHDLYFIFKGENRPGVLMYFDYWKFAE